MTNYISGDTSPARGVYFQHRINPQKGLKTEVQPIIKQTTHPITRAITHLKISFLLLIFHPIIYHGKWIQLLLLFSGLSFFFPLNIKKIKAP